MVCGVNVNVWVGLCCTVMFQGAVWGWVAAGGLCIGRNIFCLVKACIYPSALFYSSQLAQGAGQSCYLTYGLGGRELLSVTVPRIVYI